MAATLEAIRTKVRRLTRSPSVAQITDAQIDTYIDDFVLYDFPEHLRTFTLRTTLDFYTTPYIDTYETSNDPANGLYQFRNTYTAVHPPVYIAGRQAFFTQSREQFYAIYPLTNSIETIGTGNGALLNFAGTLTAFPVLRNNVLFSSIDANNGRLWAYDDGQGNLDGSVTAGDIDYVTGDYDVTFVVAPGNGEDITAQTLPYQPSLPTSVLYFENKFILRPVPDQSYRVRLEVDKVPTQLINDDDVPDIDQWWQYIAYGAAKKIFEDRTDTDSIAMIMPEFDKQERLVLRRTIVQQTNERTATIYTEHANRWYGYDFWGNNY